MTIVAEFCNFPASDHVRGRRGGCNVVRWRMTAGNQRISCFAWHSGWEHSHLVKNLSSSGGSVTAELFLLSSYSPGCQPIAVLMEFTSGQMEEKACRSLCHEEHMTLLKIMENCSIFWEWCEEEEYGCEVLGHVDEVPTWLLPVSVWILLNRWATNLPTCFIIMLFRTCLYELDVSSSRASLREYVASWVGGGCCLSSGWT